MKHLRAALRWLRWLDVQLAGGGQWDGPRLVVDADVYEQLVQIAERARELVGYERTCKHEGLCEWDEVREALDRLHSLNERGAA